MKNYIFTSESVCAGHPDKLCDQISDAIVDEVLHQDPHGKAAIEVMAGKNKLIIMGEVKGNLAISYEQIARAVTKRLGYTGTSFDFSNTSPIESYVHEQSAEIAHGVEADGAGDQGMMFGYACNESKEYMPLPIMIAHHLAHAIDLSREKKKLPFLRPDGKTQITMEYRNGVAHRVSKVVIAVPHDEAVSIEQVKEQLYKYVLTPVLEEYGFSFPLSDVILNGTGVWHYGGPAADTGLTGRKIVVDTYGGYARIGGGCFSGKDPSKVDRSGAYAARFIAKNIVAHGLADRAEVRLAYAIGYPKPLMQEIDTFGRSHLSQKALHSFVATLLDTSVRGIIDTLDLRRSIYEPTAAYGHFGREGFAWEKIVG